VNRGAFLVLEGIDGSGKSTQVERLVRRLRAGGVDTLVTREPTTGAAGRRLRELARSAEPVDSELELRLFVEDRGEHVAFVIEPALRAGRAVVCDRYTLSTVAYQGARGPDPAELLARGEAEFPLPDLVLLLEIDPAEALRRVRDRGATDEPAFERREFLERVAAVFAGVDRDYVVRVDASGAPDAVADRVSDAVRRRLDLPPESGPGAHTAE
jgi:dTMP kinase